jgi:hypothetical protein
MAVTRQRESGGIAVGRQAAERIRRNCGWPSRGRENRVELRMAVTLQRELGGIAVGRHAAERMWRNYGWSSRCRGGIAVGHVTRRTLFL